MCYVSSYDDSLVLPAGLLSTASRTGKNKQSIPTFLFISALIAQLLSNILAVHYSVHYMPLKLFTIVLCNILAPSCVAPTNNKIESISHLTSSLTSY